jgi:hypothetical protein
MEEIRVLRYEQQPLRRGLEIGGKSAWEAPFVKVIGPLRAHEGHEA